MGKGRTLFFCFVMIWITWMVMRVEGDVKRAVGEIHSMQDLVDAVTTH